jgi:hypothetical protein
VICVNVRFAAYAADAHLPFASGRLSTRALSNTRLVDARSSLCRELLIIFVEFLQLHHATNFNYNSPGKDTFYKTLNINLSLSPIDCGRSAVVVEDGNFCVFVLPCVCAFRGLRGIGACGVVASTGDSCEQCRVFV